MVLLFSALDLFLLFKTLFVFKNSLEKNRIGACGATKLAEELVRCPEIQFVR